jgi:tetratricopeptide (TPR) repeat protein
VFPAALQPCAALVRRLAGLALVAMALPAAAQEPAPVPTVPPAAPAERPTRGEASTERLVELQRAVAALPADVPLSGQAAAHNALGLEHWRFNRFDSALVHIQRAGQLWREAADTAGMARAYNNVGITYVQWGHYEPALEAFRRSLQMRRIVGDVTGEALVLTNKGAAYRDLGLLNRALPLLQEAVAVAERTGEPQRLGYALHNLGVLHLRAGRHADARAALESSIRQYERMDEGAPRRDASSGWALNSVHLGLLQVLEGDADGGIQLLHRVREAAAAEDHQRHESTALLHLGLAYRAKGEMRGSLDALQKALQIATGAELRTILLDVLAELATTHELRGETTLALRRFRELAALRDTVISQRVLQRLAVTDLREVTERRIAENTRLRQEQLAQKAVISRQRIVAASGAALLLMALALLATLFHFNRVGRERARQLSHANVALADANRELMDALSEVRTLKGLIPICSNCKNVRDDRGFWEGVETYISNRSDALFSHSICAECGPVIYGADWPTPDPAPPGA